MFVNFFPSLERKTAINGFWILSGIKWQPLDTLEYMSDTQVLVCLQYLSLLKWSPLTEPNRFIVL